MYSAKELEYIRQQVIKQRDTEGIVMLPPGIKLERCKASWSINPYGIYECSNCGINLMTPEIEAYKYCHHCGAKMEVSNE